MEEDDDFKSDFVAMPWDDNTKIFVTQDDNVSNICSRWELIQNQLRLPKNISNVDYLIEMIKSYNVTFEKEGQQIYPHWKCLVLRQYFSHMNDFERAEFFQESGILSTIRNLALQLRELLPRLRILKSGVASSIKLHQLQIASILANAFLCTFPKGKGDCPSINFNMLYEGPSSSVLKYNIEKVKCIVHYFKRIHNKQPTGNLSFHRLVIPDHKFPRWDKTTAELCSLKVDACGKIEDQEGFLQMDFANRYIGGGVLGRGCVQEEIRFVICPELISARLFTEGLADNEAIFIVGAERFCRYSGYSNTFTFVGDYQDTTPFDENRHRKSYLIVLDALYFHHSSEQYRESKILRELKKAYVGFKLMDVNYALPLATGNWGCGAFGGDPQLKSILQLMASSQARRDILYLTFGNIVLKNQIEELYQVLKNKAVNVGMLYRIIRLYNKDRRKNQTVFEFIMTSLSRPEKRKLSSKTLTPPSSSQMSSTAFESDFMSPTKSKHKIETRSPKETVDEKFPQLNIDFHALDKLVESAKESENTESSSLLDVMWFKNEKITSSNKEQEEESESQNQNSPSMFSDDKKMDVTSVGFFNKEDRDMFEPDTSQRQASEGTPKPKKMLQSKITDCFFKK